MINICLKNHVQSIFNRLLTRIFISRGRKMQHIRAANSTRIRNNKTPESPFILELLVSNRSLALACLPLTEL